MPHCNVHNIGKYVKLSFNESDSHSTFPSQLVHSEVYLAHVDSIYRYKYYILFVNDCSHYLWIYSMKFKHEVFENFLESKALVENVL